MDYELVTLDILKKKNEEENETAFVEGHVSTTCRKEGQHKQHTKPHAPPVQPVTIPSFLGAMLGREHRCRLDIAGSTGAGGRCKLPKYLTSWKDPEDGFAQTTDASQMQRVSQLLPWAAHSNCPWLALLQNLLPSSHAKDSYLLGLGCARTLAVLKAPR